MNQHQLIQRPSRPSLKSRAWVSAILLAGLSACVGPVREGDVDWDNFSQLNNDAVAANKALSAARDAKEAEAEKLRVLIATDEAFLANAPDVGSRSISEKWHEKEKIEAYIDSARQAREDALRDAANFERERREALDDFARAMDEHLDGAWKKTREGALNFRWTHALGASTDNQINLTGTRTLPGGATEPFSGFLTGDGISTDSSEFGIEHYVKDGLAVSAGITVNNLVRDNEAIDFATLSYNDETQTGAYVGLKWCPRTLGGSSGVNRFGRLRPFATLSLGFMDKYSLSGSVDIPASDPLEMSMSGDSYSTFGLGMGAIYAWSDHIGFELGVNHVESLSDIGGSWNFTGSGAGGDDYAGSFSTELSMDRVYFGVVFGF